MFIFLLIILLIVVLLVAVFHDRRFEPGDLISTEDGIHLMIISVIENDYGIVYGCIRVTIGEGRIMEKYGQQFSVINPKGWIRIGRIKL